MEIKRFYNSRTESFKNSIFPYTIEAWHSLDPTINSKSLQVFKSKLLTFIRPVQRAIYRLFNRQGLKFLTQLCLGLSHLNNHKFRHKFKDCINPLCSCNLKVENTLHFFLHCLQYSTFCMGVMNKVNQIDENFSSLSDDNKVSVLLYGDSRFHDNKNNFILSVSITYILF